MFVQNLQERVLKRLTDFPHACFIDDTQLVLDPATGSAIRIDSLLGHLTAHPDIDEDMLIDAFVASFTRIFDSYRHGVEHLTRRDILGQITRVIFPTTGVPPQLEPDEYARGLVTSWGLYNGETVASLPSDRLTHAVTIQEMDRAARTKIRAYARGVRVERAFGGVILTGGRQTSSIALYPDFCAKAVGLMTSEAGYFVAMPDVNHAIIVPANDTFVLEEVAMATTDFFLEGAKKLTPFVYHHLAGKASVLISDLGLTPTLELEDLHGPMDNWPLFDDDDGLLSA